MDEYKRSFKGVWIDKVIWLNKDLTWMEKLFITEINSLDNDNGCFASNDYFATFFQLTKSRCSQIVNSLIKKGYLRAEYVRNGKEIKKRVLNILNTPIKNTKQGYLENCEDINTLSINTKERKKKVFKAPTLEEIEQYNEDKQLNIDCNFFLQYFQESNWIDVKGNKVKNWKQKMLTWSKYNKGDDRPPSERFG